jgi:autotransporter-associated beta strand protein
MKRALPASALVLCALALLAISSPAASYTNSALLPWTNAAAWTGGAFSTNDPDGFISMRPTTGSPTLTNNYPVVVLNQISLDAARNTILLGAGTLLFTNSASGPLPAILSTVASSFTFNQAINVNTALTIRSTGSGIVINSNITGLGSLVISNTGAGITRLASSNTFVGGVTVSTGGLTLAHAWALGTGPLTIAGPGSLLDSSVSSLVIATTNAQAWNANFTFTGTQGLNLGPGTVTLGTNVTLTVAANTLTVPGMITGAYALTKAGAGTLLLRNNNTFSRLLTVAAGTLAANLNSNSFVEGFFNQGSVSGYTGAVFNVGGATPADAMASSVTFTNAAGANVTLGAGAAASTFNASTSAVGILNQGNLFYYGAAGATGIFNATLFNDATGAVTGNTTAASTIIIERFPTNLGTVRFRQANRLTINQGDFFNDGLFNQEGGTHNYFTLPGQFVNGSNGVIISSEYNNWTVGGFVNYGLVLVSNGAASTPWWTINSGNLFLTNYGTFRLTRSNPNAVYGLFSATNFLNSGRFVGQGNANAISANNVVLPVGYGPSGSVPFAFTNAADGEILATNGASLAFYNMGNLGRITVGTNSAVAVGKNNENLAIRLTLGIFVFENSGILDLRGGAFGATFLTNAATGVFGGNGDFGSLTFTNVVSASQALTNFVRAVSVKPVLNLGAMAPAGILNAGAITNASGAAIIGYGEIQSFHRTNYYSGETFVATNLNAGGAVANLAGGTVLADGDTLALQNGFAANTQAGTVGTTNGGTLRLGDGTLALTNAGTVRLQGGALQLGSLVNAGSLVGTGAVQAATVASSGTLAPGFSPGTMSFSNDLTLTGSSILNLEIAGTNSTDYDRLLVGGAFARDGTLNLSFLAYTPNGGEVFDLFDFASLVGSFSATNLPVLGGGLSWDFSQFDTQGILGIVNPIPEPGALSLVLLAAAGALALRRRK